MKSKKQEQTMMQCPVCHGTGNLPEPYKTLSDAQRKHHMVKVLYENGFSYREITKYLGYASTNSVALIVKKHDSRKPRG